MKGKPEVINALNEALANEVVAITQYFMHARMNHHRGFTALADRIRQQSMDEMEHAEALIDRILFLEGTPNMQPVESPQIGETVTEQLQNDLALERNAVKQLNGAITLSRKKGDHSSAELLQKILADEEKHVNVTETQLDLIDKLGETAYLMSQLRGGTTPPATP